MELVPAMLLKESNLRRAVCKGYGKAGFSVLKNITEAAVQAASRPFSFKSLLSL